MTTTAHTLHTPTSGAAGLEAGEPSPAAPPPDDDTVELDPAAAATWQKLQAVLEDIRQLTDIADDYKAQLRNHLGVGTYSVGDQPAFTITATRRFDPQRAAKLLTADQLAQVQRVVVDRALAEQVLSADEYAACQVEKGKPTVRPVK